MRRSPGLLLLAVLAAVALGGCGSKAKPLSRTAFTQQADAICRASSAEAAKVKTPSNIAQLPAAVAPAQQQLKTTVSSLKKLTAPTALQGQYGTLLDKLSGALDMFGPLIDAAKKGDAAGVTKIAQQLNAIDAQTSQLASKLGLAACAQS